MAKFATRAFLITDTDRIRNAPMSEPVPINFRKLPVFTERRAACFRTCDIEGLKREGAYAGGSARRVKATAKVTGADSNSGHHPRSGYRRNDGNFYTRPPGHAQILAGDQAGGTLAHRRQAPLL